MGYQSFPCQARDKIAADVCSRVFHERSKIAHVGFRWLWIFGSNGAFCLAMRVLTLYSGEYMTAWYVRAGEICVNEKNRLVQFEFIQK
jgi:hypothetical protein